MIPIGTILASRAGGEPIQVKGIEGQRYMLADPEFGPTFAMTFDEITAAYDCTGYKVQIEPYDEAARWRELDRQKFHGLLQDGRRQATREAALPTPEQAFAAGEAEAAKPASKAAAGLSEDAEASTRRKLRRRP
jgi:hypothetical protein